MMNISKVFRLSIKLKYFVTHRPPVSSIKFGRCRFQHPNRTLIHTALIHTSTLLLQVVTSLHSTVALFKPGVAAGKTGHSFTGNGLAGHAHLVPMTL